MCNLFPSSQEATGRIKELEDQIISERTKGQTDKKEQTEQMRSFKAEIKSLTDKIEK